MSTKAQQRYTIRDTWSDYVYNSADTLDDAKSLLVLAEIRHNDADDLGIVDTTTGRFITVVF